MHITITGDLGSGKSTVAKEICRILGFTYLSTGQIQRNLAQEMGMNTLEFNRFTDQNLHIDDYIDNKVREINDVTEPHVLDSRLAWHFIRSSFKIYLMALDEVAAQRVLKDDKRVGEPEANDIQGKIQELRERRESENIRFATNYGVKPSLFTDFDAVVDTSSASVEQVTELVVSLYKSFTQHRKAPKIWLSPMRILPTRSELTQNFEGDFPGQQSSFFNNPVPCILYKREFYVLANQKSLENYMAQKCPFVPVQLMYREGEGLFDIPGFVEKYFDELDLGINEKKFGFTYIRQKV